MKQTKWKIARTSGAAEFLGIRPAPLASRLRALLISRSLEDESHA